MRYLFQQLMMRLGYVKIPKELIYLSMYQENFLQQLIGQWDDVETLHLPIEVFKNQQKITEYLREGRFHSYVEGQS